VTTCRSTTRQRFRGCAHACRYCFARNTHTYLDMNAGRDFDREIVVKVNVPSCSARSSAGRAGSGSWSPSGPTPILPVAEGRYELMPPMIEALQETETRRRF